MEALLGFYQHKHSFDIGCVQKDRGFCWDFIYTKIHRLRLKDCRDGGLENGVRVLASVHVMFYALIVFAFSMDRFRRPSW